MISIHPPRAGRDHGNREIYDDLLISIHPPRAGRDPEKCRRDGRLLYISIHPPRAGRDLTARTVQIIIQTFQSTLPVRGGTRNPSRDAAVFRFQSTLPVRGGTLYKFHLSIMCKFQSTLPVRGGTITFSRIPKERVISIHPPRAGRDVPL